MDATQKSTKNVDSKQENKQEDKVFQEKEIQLSQEDMEKFLVLMETMHKQSFNSEELADEEKMEFIHRYFLDQTGKGLLYYKVNITGVSDKTVAMCKFN